MNIQKYILGAVLIIGLTPAFSLYAQPRNAQNEVKVKIWILGNRLIDEGFHLTHKILWGRMSNGQSKTVKLQLLGREEYIIVSACDNDCYDMNLDFYDSNWNRLAYNHKRTDVPYVAATRGFQGTFYVKVTMVRCATFTCQYGVSVFGR